MRFIVFRLCIVWLLSCLSTLVWGQNKVDFWLKDVVRQYSENPQTVIDRERHGILLKASNGVSMVDVIVQTTDNDFSFLKSYGSQLRTSIGNYATAQVPVEKIHEIAALKNVTYVSGAKKLRVLNDLSTAVTGARAAAAAGYIGKEVIIGIVDTGLDITHPGFMTKDGKTRVLYLWDQTESGVPPGDPYYDYGTEWTNDQIDNGVCTSKDVVGHGTHVTGTIAMRITDSGDSLYNGGAIGANLIIVKTNFNGTSVLDGINYIFEKARQLQKPAIVNLSLGSQQGPHDGLDPLVVAQDRLTGPGRLIVQSVGNDGSSRIHHKVNADSDGEDMVFTLENSATFLNFELWYEGDENVSFQLFAPGAVFPPIPSGAPVQRADESFGKIVIDNASDGPEYYNNDKRISVSIDNAAGGEWKFRLISSNPTDVHAWMWDGDPQAKFKFDTNDNHYTLVNEACARRSIVVGAYVTKDRFKVRGHPDFEDGTELLTGEVIGDIASFSSGGPTRDEREKPDVVAPGSMIASAHSSQIDASALLYATSDFRDFGPSYLLFGTESFDIQIGQGTSYSSPGVSGPLAQLMGARKRILNENMTPAEAQEYTTQNCKSLGSLNTVSARRKGSGPGQWDYRAGYGIFSLEALLGNNLQLVAVRQSNSTGKNITVEFNKPVNGADDPVNYEIRGPSSDRTITAIDISGSIVTITFDRELVVGKRDILVIKNITSIDDMESFAQPVEVEIEKIGTIVTPLQILTNQIWRPEEDPYYIDGDVQVSSRARLTIMPGTEIRFLSNQKDSSALTVFGELFARGTPAKPIVFSAVDTTKNGSWGGLYFSSQIPQTLLKYIEIRYADAGITSFSDQITIEDSKISHSYDFGILVLNSSPVVRRTIVYGTNGGRSAEGIRLQSASSATRVENVTIYNNSGWGIVNLSASPKIINCIIADNGRVGIHSQDGGAPEVTYTDVWNHTTNFNGVAKGVGTIEQDPLFTMASNGNFQLEKGSPAIDMGDPDVAFNDLDGTRNDMGALARLAPLTGFQAMPSNNDVALNWQTRQTGKTEGAFILRSPSESVNTWPKPGVTYESGTTLGNATVIVTPEFGNNTGLIDSTVDAGIEYYYAAWAVYEGLFYSADTIAATVTITTDVVYEDNSQPTKFELFPNYPNPFNPSTTITFDVPKTVHVQLVVYDLQGRKVRSLADKSIPTGRYSVIWAGKDDRSRLVSSGIYLIKLTAGVFEKTIKSTFVK